VGARCLHDNATALHIAAANPHSPTSGAVAALLEAGADPTAVDARGRTPLDNAREALRTWQALAGLGMSAEPARMLEAFTAVVRELEAAQAAARRCGPRGRRARWFRLGREVALWAWLLWASPPALAVVEGSRQALAGPQGMVPGRRRRLRVCASAAGVPSVAFLCSDRFSPKAAAFWHATMRPTAAQGPTGAAGR
jgi:hypothetical protein